MLKQLRHTLRMTYSDTTHGRFIQHMDLARTWLRANGRGTTAQQISRTMGRLTATQLAELLAAQDDPRVCRDCGRSIDVDECFCPD
jgi:hypothetical protein